MKALELLETLQKSYDRPKFFNRDFSDEVIRGVVDALYKLGADEGTIEGVAGDEYEKIMALYRAEQETMPTALESSHFYNMLKDSFVELCDIVDSKREFSYSGQSLKKHPIPIYGTIQDDSFNAFIALADDGPLIVFNEGLLKFATNLIEVLVEEVIRAKRNTLSLTDHEKLTKRFIDIMVCFHFYGETYAAIPLELEGFIDEQHLFFQHAVTTSVILFIVSHEYAHLLLSHVDDLKTYTSTIRDVEVEIMQSSWTEELDADRLGAEILFMGSGVYDTFSLYLSIFILHLCEIHRIKESATHPPLKARARNIIDFINSQQKELHHENIDSVFGPKIEYYQKFIEFLETKGLSFKEDLSSIQMLLYEEFTLE